MSGIIFEKSVDSTIKKDYKGHERVFFGKK